jgi:hypothetical protein
MAQINKPSNYFNTKLYTGNFSTQSITGVGFQPDLCWIKNRDQALNPTLLDAVRGLKFLYTNESGAEGDFSSNFTSFDSDGFSVGANNNVNGNGNGIVSWNWLASNTTASNTDGSITSTVSANTTSGFSIVTYTGNGSSGATVGHGLGVAPKMTIIKQRNSANGWNVWAYANNNGDPDSFGELNSTAAWYQNQGASGPFTATPNSSVLTLTNYGQVNASSATYVAYCFAEKKGFSKFGSYQGNSSTDGSFVYLGFKPAMVIIKQTNGVSEWILLDNKRDSYNVVSGELYPNDPASENRATVQADFLSNGIKFRRASGNFNISGETYIYMAFAESPLVGTNNIPAVAR